MAALATTGSADKHYSTEEDSRLQQARKTSPVCSDGVDPAHKAALFFREAHRNKRQIEKLEKERTLGVQCRKNGWSDVSTELEEYEKVLEERRSAEKINLNKQLVTIHNGVRRFQRQLIDVKPTPELIERLKEIMSEVETSINALKEEQHSCLEELLKEEKTCKQEITAYEKKLENWSLVVNSEPKLTTAQKTRPLDRDVPAEVRALEVFLQKTGGIYGGWDQYDHQAFLKVWTKHNGHPAYKKEAKLYLPGKTLEEIEQHEDWHQKLICLQDRKREAIQRWKASKHQERQNRLQQQEETEQAERREKEAKGQVQQQRAEEERREAALRLEEWREEKKRKEEQDEQQRLSEEIQRRRLAKEERRRQLEVKLTIEEQLRLKREEDEEQKRKRMEEEQREMEERRREAAKGIRRFNERDLQKVEAKLQEKLLREKEEEERQRRIVAKLKDKVDGHISRDPSRLTRPTKGWEERMKQVGPSGGGPVLHMFHRAVPTWRQGL
ncbi:coiled-coil domain-containing protein 112 isoform X2 [Betta splendens]|uniref:Coiled-coil domain-containing protein 112 isoform X2 n=1 Tax=Betta splendens TaxID=158456 RepID=A0A6P7NMM6_BETSP|nr:coiled-coil domain-containing protein 112 isoform X2 [Betta splendens]